MAPPLESNRIQAAYQRGLSALLAERTPDGHWVGELSTSALSTATAVSALSLVARALNTDAHAKLISRGLAWLADHQNADGGWGDTVKSVSNLSTSMLGLAAIHLARAVDRYADCLQRVEAYLKTHGGATREAQAEAVRARYGKDRTFAVPILTTCALAGLVSWREVKSLPFELACVPQAWFRFLRLPVVSYALPALIAIGQAVYRHRPPRNPLAWLLRRLAVRKSLRVLERIQPTSGGFLEAIPLTSFVTLSLASIGRADHPVCRKGMTFLVSSVRPDGSWPIDSNLATWVTTLAINALAAAGELAQLEKQEQLRQWLTRQQFRERHPYTGARPGGWGWTDLPGSVPDADDTSGVLLALSELMPPSQHPVAAETEAAVSVGLNWLRRLQNSDGGWPTFCRGWANLPFDRSGPDLAAHALRAFAAWRRPVDDRNILINYEKNSASRAYQVGNWRGQSEKAIWRGLRYLRFGQRSDGSWLPLWFGNQFAPHDENPTYGTARVLAAYRDLHKMKTEPARRGVAWLMHAQNADGGWGGAAGVASSIEETALAVEVLLDAGPEADMAVNNGLVWLVQQVEVGGLSEPTPIGFYFAKLWYFEKLYPIIFTVAALGRALRKRCKKGSDPFCTPSP